MKEKIGILKLPKHWHSKSSFALFSAVHMASTAQKLTPGMDSSVREKETKKETIEETSSRFLVNTIHAGIIKRQFNT